MRANRERLFSEAMQLSMLFKWMVLFFMFSSVYCMQDFPALDHIRSKTPSYKQAETVADLIERVIGPKSIAFVVKVDPSIGPVDKDTFKLENSGSQIAITGSSGVAAAWGFYYYLSQFCGCHVSWGGNQVNIPDVLPKLPAGGVTVTSNDKFRYYQNVCTVSYSFVWYNWTDWEKMIDWMAMNGINLALAFNGQEAIWQRVYLKMGFTQAEIDSHFSGPAFLAWLRMGNMRGFGGPLTQNWHLQQVALQHRILQRMRDFGMTPVLPAFNGDVPNAITRLYPTAKVTHLSNWGSFNSSYCCMLLLDLNDPLFQKIGKSFLDEYIKEFGTDHVYNTDTFNEMDPPSGDPAYLASAAKAVYNGLIAADSKAVWLMQGWLFLSGFWTQERAKALLTAVPQGRMIILDLFSEVDPQYTRMQSYFGQPYIWCMLHDFGGTMSLYGVIEVVNKGPVDARKNSTIIGTGLTMEGINQNYVMYEFMLENSWRQKPRNITQWIENYSLRRYGASNADVNFAWQKLKGSVYNCSIGISDFAVQIVTARPSLNNPIKPQVWYNPEDFFVAWDRFVLAADKFRHSYLYKYDLVDVTRQSLGLLAIVYYNQLLDAYENKNQAAFTSAEKSLLNLLVDMNDLLETDDHFLLGPWLESAKSLGMNEDERKQYEYNARNQITLWGPDGNILDYANKYWAGLVKGYYYPRWQWFIAELTLQWNTTFNETKFRHDVFIYAEKPFTFDRSVYPTSGTGHQVKVATKLHKRYRPETSRMSSSFEQLHSNEKNLHFLPKERPYIYNSGKQYASAAVGSSDNQL